MDEKRFQSGGTENAALRRRRRRRRNAGDSGGGRQRGKPNLGVARSLDFVVVVVNGGDGDDVNQLHVTLDTSAASGKWSAGGTAGGAPRGRIHVLDREDTSC